VNVGRPDDDDGAVVAVDDGALDALEALRGFGWSLQDVMSSAAATTKTTPRRCIRAIVEVVVRRDVIT
jgi:hypothetical protein